MFSSPEKGGAGEYRLLSNEGGLLPRMYVTDDQGKNGEAHGFDAFLTHRSLPRPLRVVIL